MKRSFYLLLCITAALLLSQSCTEPQDFSQFEDLSITPTLATGLFYMESDEETINEAGSLVTFYSQTVNFDAFNEQYVAEHLIEGTITYEIVNTTSKQLRITIEFLDEAGNTLDVEQFDVEADPSGTNIWEVAYGPGGKSLDILANTSSLRITAFNFGDASSVSAQTEPKIKFKSAAEFLFRLK
ncbi:hypothetical protein [Flagellimonas sediminis]|uniref:Uncharacterized protein n=1 Tax=Flagellimonas sediminis TaxID=2696468 RepID=A0A6I5KS22_9FLAO|nr:hypothetical protein [Allomuricauda sediminis]NDV43714.1 hypothetical protein [Allomuricauda sediminis]